MISPIHHVAPVETPQALGNNNAAPGEFRNFLEAAVGAVESSRNTAAQAVEKFLSGEDQELHSAILDTQRAELQFELFLQTRNKVVQAYQEIMRMQV